MQGVEYIYSDTDAAKNHFSFHTTDLYNNIKNGNYPSWKV